MILVQVIIKCDNCCKLEPSNMEASRGPAGLDKANLKGWTLGTSPRHPVAYCPECAGVALDHLGGLTNGAIPYEVVE